MLADYGGADWAYIACSYTNLRRGIDGLVSLVQQQFHLDPFTNTMFLFCGDSEIGSMSCTGKATALY